MTTLIEHFTGAVGQPSLQLPLICALSVRVPRGKRSFTILKFVFFPRPVKQDHPIFPSFDSCAVPHTLTELPGVLLSILIPYVTIPVRTPLNKIACVITLLCV